MSQLYVMVDKYYFWVQTPSTKGLYSSLGGQIWTSFICCQAFLLGQWSEAWLYLLAGGNFLLYEVNAFGTYGKYENKNISFSLWIKPK